MGWINLRQIMEKNEHKTAMKKLARSKKKRPITVVNDKLKTQNATSINSNNSSTSSKRKSSDAISLNKQSGDNLNEQSRFSLEEEPDNLVEEEKGARVVRHAKESQKCNDKHRNGKLKEAIVIVEDFDKENDEIEESVNDGIVIEVCTSNTNGDEPVIATEKTFSSRRNGTIDHNSVSYEQKQPESQVCVVSIQPTNLKKFKFNDKSSSDCNKKSNAVEKSKKRVHKRYPHEKSRKENMTRSGQLNIDEDDVRRSRETAKHLKRQSISDRKQQRENQNNISTELNTCTSQTNMNAKISRMDDIKQSAEAKSDIGHPKESLPESFLEKEGSEYTLEASQIGSVCASISHDLLRHATSIKLMKDFIYKKLYLKEHVDKGSGMISAFNSETSGIRDEGQSMKDGISFADDSFLDNVNDEEGKRSENTEISTLSRVQYPQKKNDGKNRISSDPKKLMPLSKKPSPPENAKVLEKLRKILELIEERKKKAQRRSTNCFCSCHRNVDKTVSRQPVDENQCLCLCHKSELPRKQKSSCPHVDPNAKRNNLSQGQFRAPPEKCGAMVEADKHVLPSETKGRVSTGRRNDRFPTTSSSPHHYFSVVPACDRTREAFQSSDLINERVIYLLQNNEQVDASEFETVWDRLPGVGEETIVQSPVYVNKFFQKEASVPCCLRTAHHETDNEKMAGKQVNLRDYKELLRHVETFCHKLMKNDLEMKRLKEKFDHLVSKTEMAGKRNSR